MKVLCANCHAVEHKSIPSEQTQTQHRTRGQYPTSPICGDEIVSTVLQRESEE